jgi:hypothetical protein
VIQEELALISTKWRFDCARQNQDGNVHSGNKLIFYFSLSDLTNFRRHQATLSIGNQINIE